jgi:hypothetical protein
VGQGFCRGGKNPVGKARRGDALSAPFGAKAARPRQKSSTSACNIDTAYTIVGNVVVDTKFLFYFSRLGLPTNEAIREMPCYVR